MPAHKKHLEELEVGGLMAAAVIEPWSAPAAIPAALKALNEIAEAGHKWRQHHPEHHKRRVRHAMAAC